MVIALLAWFYLWVNLTAITGLGWPLIPVPGLCHSRVGDAIAMAHRAEGRP